MATNILPGIGLGAPTLAGSSTLGYPQPAQPVHQMARNVLSDHCVLLVYERQMLLKEAVERMPGDYDLNRKLLGDLFLMNPCHMTLEQAASLAFVFGEDCHVFLKLCDEVGAIIPSGK